MYLAIQKIFDFQSYGIFDAIILYYFYSMLNLDQRHETCGLQTKVQPLVHIFVAYNSNLYNQDFRVDCIAIKS